MFLVMRLTGRYESASHTPVAVFETDSAARGWVVSHIAPKLEAAGLVRGCGSENCIDKSWVGCWHWKSDDDEEVWMSRSEIDALREALKDLDKNFWVDEEYVTYYVLEIPRHPTPVV